MRHFQRVPFRRSAWLLAGALAVSCVNLSSAFGKDADALMSAAKAFAAKGNFNAAEIELRNAEREAPENTQVRAMLAEVYLKLGNYPSAERTARAARDLGGTEEQYLLPLAEAMLRQGKFSAILDQIKPGTRPAAIESKVRVILAMASAGLRDRAQTETLLRGAVALDESALAPKIALARTLLSQNRAEAEKLVDEILGIDPRAPEAIALKGNILASRGDIDGALKLFDEALAINPNNIVARLDRANINLTRRDFAAVDRDLDPVLKLAPQNFGANYLRALEHFKKREFATADKILDRLSPTFINMPEGLYVQAATKYELKQYSQAEEIVAKYVARVPRNVQGARLAALIAMRRKAPDLAVKYLTAYLAQSPADFTTLTLLGNAYVSMRKPALALEQFQRAASLEPENISLKAMVAASEIDAGAGRKGLEELEEIFATEAGMTVAGPTLVLTELRAGRPEKAVKVAEKLVNSDANNVLYQNLLGLAYLGQADYPHAEGVLKGLVARQPDFGPATTNLANVYLRAGRPEDAERVYREFLKRKPEDVTGLIGLADVATARQQWDEAITNLTKARAAAPADPAPGLKLLNLYAARQDWTRATTLARELTIQFPSNINLLEAQGRILVASGDRDGAIDTYRRGYEIAPGSGTIFSRYVSLLTAARRFPDLQAALQTQLDRDPTNTGLKSELIRVAAEIGGLEAGLAKARAFAKSDPSSTTYDIVAADLLRRAGKPAEAIGLLEKTAAAKPTDDEPVIALARLYSVGGDNKRAEELLTISLKKRPNSVTLRAALADLYIAENKFDQAIAEQQWVLSERQNDPGALNNLAWLYQKVGDLSKARDLAERAATISPGNGAVADTLGWILLAQGDVDRALSQLQAASAAMPGNMEIQYHVAVALSRAGRAPDARAMLEKLLDSGATFASKADAQRLLDELKRG